MGAQHPKPQNPSCEILISLDRSIFFPGETIKGGIIINSKENIRISSLLLSLTQQESWNHQKEKKKKESNVTLAEDFIEVSSEIYPGKARFSFKFVIPEFTISSFEYPGVGINIYSNIFECEYQ